MHSVNVLGTCVVPSPLRNAKGGDCSKRDKDKQERRYMEAFRPQGLSILRMFQLFWALGRGAERECLVNFGNRPLMHLT
jgi:hypothetical protein